MIKKISIILVILFIVVSCGKKGDPEYKKSNLQTIYKNS